MPVAVILILTMLILPLPPLMLDFFFTLNILLALLIIMVALNTAETLHFSSFPTIILFATMLRLGLNVASTRVVLLEGHQGGDAAGKVIAAFGEFVIGGNYVVGFIVFAILMIINFIVITKGAGRVSEVIARFTLDALPGKQMAIDADLNAGVIDQETAKQRRAQVAQESDFFGSMDGASARVYQFALRYPQLVHAVVGEHQRPGAELIDGVGVGAGDAQGGGQRVRFDCGVSTLLKGIGTRTKDVIKLQR